jgi:hypothetical protein
LVILAGVSWLLVVAEAFIVDILATEQFAVVLAAAVTASLIAATRRHAVQVREDFRDALREHSEKNVQPALDMLAKEIARLVLDFEKIFKLGQVSEQVAKLKVARYTEEMNGHDSGPFPVYPGRLF